MFDEFVRDWGGEQVAARYDAGSDTWMLVGVHSTALGPAMGGTRLKAYERAEDAWRDVVRLSSAMTGRTSPPAT